MLAKFDIPDPFMTVKTKQYGLQKGYQYDYFNEDWNFTCLACNTELLAMNKYDMLKTQLYHTRNDCLGGW